MPPVLGVVILVVLWATVELVAWIVERRARRRPAQLPSVPSTSRALPTRVAITQRSLPRPGAPLPTTCVVLVHGFAGFDELRIAGRSAAYFRGVRERLASRGIACVVPRLPAVASIEERARALAERLASLEGTRVHLVAHSMGGLDARFALARHRLPHVRALVTVATPHRGTPLAELGARIVGGSRLGDVERALRDLAPSRLVELAPEMPDVEGVRYASVVVSPRVAPIHPLLLPTHRVLSRWIGENDGLVPVASQAWGEVIGHADTDHWGAVGWGAAFDAPSFYAAIADRLEAEAMEVSPYEWALEDARPDVVPCYLHGTPSRALSA